LQLIGSAFAFALGIFTGQPYGMPMEIAMAGNRGVVANGGYEGLQIVDFTTPGLPVVLGQEVAQLIDGALAAGRNAIPFYAGDLPSGVYVYRVAANGFVAQRKMVLLK
jgi:hypothetical protein